ncbi:bidirectional sugar transporter NEC1-like [Diospyros lotus]|uniref:bidirectional sugar transporter NEC1-like n=1 Tax=Diospyros lotus TaxID=55363 RepID=UPI0022595FC2|nr:bidirectional sugar transporter NEC1-like [Diospyros lotus]XP_052189840.1 bidirectional sugar transporter NEC1-like [Diospyros lotus]
MALLTVHQLAFISGLLGNVVSFLVFLAPVPTFYKIYKKKTSEGYQSIPYSVALFSAVLLLYYAIVKTNAFFIVSINGIGTVIETIYLVIYFVYAPKKEKLFTMRLVLLFNVGCMSFVVLFTLLFVKGPNKVTVVGSICAAVNLAVFASPLCVMGQVIRTKSVEFLPVTLSFFLTLCATSWFFYGFFVKDFYIAIPNVVGFLLGIAQIILYFIYKDAKKDKKIAGEKAMHAATDQKRGEVEMEPIV